ncbi:MAG: homoserine kinase [Verrucomicrobiae bacterium]|nr:homoserine kinase [Verrucomicrobiae bacterium]
MKQVQVKVRVPATTANLGPGFDCLGVALKLYNTIAIKRENSNKISSGMIRESANLFFKSIQQKPFSFSTTIQGDVPISRGLGSSVTLRAGVVSGLNFLAGEPLSQAECLNLVIQLEGHPDNAAPAFLGGFTVATDETILRVPILPKLKFIAVIPEIEVETEKARKVLPKTLPFTDAVKSEKQAALVAAAFAAQKYELLQNAFEDRLHQPYRKKLLPFLDEVVEAGMQAGALGGFLSGSGSTMMCLSLGSPKLVAQAMKKILAKRRLSFKVVILEADNEGIRVLVG